MTSGGLSFGGRAWDQKKLRSRITIERNERMAKTKILPPVHPGEVLREEFLKPMRLTPYAVARACSVPRTRIERLAREETPITADTALRLARYFGTTPAFWMGMQAQYELERAQDMLAAELKRISPFKQAAA
jgi:addiction module HigA family antidote